MKTDREYMEEYQKAVQEYRKESYGKVRPDKVFPIWRPDEDADQMLMVWEYLRKQGLRLQFIWNKKEWSMDVYDARFGSMQKGESIFVVTMEAFMEYIKQT